MIAMVLSVSTVLVNSFGGRLIPKGREAERPVPEVQRLELHVPSMHCEGCLRTITTVVSRLPEVEGVEGDLERKTITVLYRHGQTAPDRIRRAVRESGFLVG